MIWYDYVVIKLNNIFESLGKMGLVRRFKATLCLWINTGTVNVTVGAGWIHAICGEGGSSDQLRIKL